MPGLGDLIRSHSILEVAAHQWQYSVAAGLSFPLVHPHARYLRLHYERLVSDPEAELRSVAQFLGARFDPAGVLERVDVIAGGETWRDVLDAEELGQVQSVAGHMLRSLGYD